MPINTGLDWRTNTQQQTKNWKKTRNRTAQISPKETTTTRGVDESSGTTWTTAEIFSSEYTKVENNQPNSWDASYTKTDFDWLGHCKSNEVTEFVDQSFDLLISYYKPNRYELKIVTAMSKAKFKVGIFCSLSSSLAILSIVISP